MTHPRIVAILQARMGATRLPGKPLKTVLGRTLLSYELERLHHAKTLSDVVVATTISPRDQPIVDECLRGDIPVFCGSEEDVLDRYYQAAKAHQAQIVVRVTGDCPLIDPAILDRVVNYYLHHQPSLKYVSNTLKLTYPRGLDVEVFSFDLLERAWREAKDPEEREHVTPYFYKHPEVFALGNVGCEKDYSSHRWTVDTEEDFQLVRHIIEALYPSNPLFHMDDVLLLLKHHPDWVALNAHIKQKQLKKRP